MKDSHLWKASKYVWRGNHFQASRHLEQVSAGSRGMADAVAACYQCYVPVHAKGRLIDLGCGQVPLYGLYQAYVQDVVCVDWGHSLHSKHHNHLDVCTDLNEPLPFDNETFDTIILSDVLEHVHHPWQLFSEISRILKPEGCILLNVPFLYGIHEAPHDYFRYTEFALKKFAQQQNLEILVFQPVGGSLSVLTDLVAKHLQGLPWVGIGMAQILQNLFSWIQQSKFIKRFETFSAKSYPLGYFMVVTKASQKQMRHSLHESS